MQHYGLEPQVVVTYPLLVGLDGDEKMSKSKGNYIGITEPPADMFRKIMNMSDTLTWRYYELLTDISMQEIEGMRATVDPLAAKKDLARRIVAEFHSSEDADRVASAWGGLPPVETLDHHSATDPRVNRVLQQAKFVNSVTEADKMIKTAGTVQAFRLPSNEEVAITGPAQKLQSGDYIIRAGKKLKHVVISDAAS